MIRSFLDQDLYTFTVGQAIAEKHFGVPVSYTFRDRNRSRYNQTFLNKLQDALWDMNYLKMHTDEALYLKSLKFLNPSYVDSLQSYRFDPSEVNCFLDDDDCLNLTIKGPWERTVYWEVPLLATISELYFKHCDTNWENDIAVQVAQLQQKSKNLANCYYADFGTRRRRNFETQELVVRELLNKPGFRGTSNVHLARIYGTRPIGTMSHQWIMGVSALVGLRHANKFALTEWSEVFKGDLGIALPDTFGTAAFFEDFDGYLARLFDGVRHDSGDPFEFGEKVIAHYEKLNIDPKSKVIVFSDGLTDILGAQLSKHFEGRIKISLGIGTFLTNDFPNSKPLNIVIKLASCMGIPVVKLSDFISKATGDKDALRVAKWVFFNTPLDA